MEENGTDKRNRFILSIEAETRFFTLYYGINTGKRSINTSDVEQIKVVKNRRAELKDKIIPRLIRTLKEHRRKGMDNFNLITIRQNVERQIFEASMEIDQDVDEQVEAICNKNHLIE